MSERSYHGATSRSFSMCTGTCVPHLRNLPDSDVIIDECHRVSRQTGQATWGSWNKRLQTPWRTVIDSAKSSSEPEMDPDCTTTAAI